MEIIIAILSLFGILVGMFGSYHLGYLKALTWCKQILAEEHLKEQYD